MENTTTKPLNNLLIWANTTLTFLGTLVCLAIAIKSAFFTFNWQNLLVSVIGLVAFALAFTIEIRRERHTYKMFPIIVWCYALAILLNSILFPYDYACLHEIQSDASRATALLESVLVFAGLFTFYRSWRDFKFSKRLITIMFIAELVTAILLSINGPIADSANKFLTIASLYLRPIMAGALAVAYITHQTIKGVTDFDDAKA